MLGFVVEHVMTGRELHVQSGDGWPAANPCPAGEAACSLIR